MKTIRSFREFSAISENVKYHIYNNIPFTGNIFRTGSESFYDLLVEVRNLHENKQIILEGLDKELYESTDIGSFGIYEGKRVPLDIPMLNEDLSTQVAGDKIFSIHDKNKGDIIKVEGEDVIFKEPKQWVKNKEANCLKFSGELDGKLVDIKYDDTLDVYIFESLYKGKKVKLNKPMRSSGPKKYKVYVKNPKTGNVKVVNFGDVKGGLTAKINDKAARKSFVARHQCDRKWKPEDKLSAAYWSCRLPKFKNLVTTDFSGYW
jgi:hypothetical protein